VSDRAFIMWLGGIILAVIIVVVVAVDGGGYYAGKASCRHFGQNTNRVVQFRVLVSTGPIPWSWDCFTPVAGGKWVPTSALREFSRQP